MKLRDRRRARLPSALAARQRRFQRTLAAFSVLVSAEPLELADLLRQPY